MTWNIAYMYQYTFMRLRFLKPGKYMKDHSQTTGRQGNQQNGIMPASVTQTRWDFMIPPRYSVGYSLASSGASNAPRLLRLWKMVSEMHRSRA